MAADKLGKTSRLAAHRSLEQGVIVPGWSSHLTLINPEKERSVQSQTKRLLVDGDIEVGADFFYGDSVAVVDIDLEAGAGELDRVAAGRKPLAHELAPSGS